MKSLRSRIIIIIVSFSLLIALTVAFLSFNISMRYLTESQRQSSYINVQLLGNEVDSELNTILSFCNRLELDSAVENYLTNVPAVRNESITAYHRLSMDVWNHLNDEYRLNPSHDLISRFMVATPDGEDFLHIAIVQNNTTVELADSVISAPFFKELLYSEDYRYTGFTTSPVNNRENIRIMPIVRPVRRFTSPDIIGFIYVEVSDELILRHLNNLNLPADSELYFTFEDGNSFRCVDRSLEKTDLPKGLVTYTLPGKNISVSVLPSGSELRNRTVFYLLIIVAVIMFIILTGAVIYILLKKIINDPVDALILKLKKVGNGDFSRDPAIEWDNELGEIGRGINSLSYNVDALFQAKLKDERERQALEYRILQSQINPHFMYNTLNTIKWMASIQGADGIADMSTALSRLLKNVSKVADPLIPLKDEIALLNDYFTIMKYRYGGTIELSYEIEDDDLMTCLVNRFSLQPVVENAIFHGIEPRGSAGSIDICVYSKDERLCIDVSDNGVGMDEEAIERLFSADETSSNDFFKEVGVANVNSRIKFSFGEEYGLSAESVPGEGTTIHYILPIKRKSAQREV